MIRSSSPLTMLLSRHTRRREFTTLIGGAAAWPLAASAQQADKVYRIGYLGLASAAAQATRMKALGGDWPRSCRALQDKKTHERGRVTFVYSTLELRDEFIAVLFNGHDEALAVPDDSVRKVSARQS